MSIKRIKESVAEINGKISEQEGFFASVKNFTHDGEYTLSFDIECADTKASYTVLLPETYPKGEISVFGDETKTYKSNDVSALISMFQDLEKQTRPKLSLRSASGADYDIDDDDDDSHMEITAEDYSGHTANKTPNDVFSPFDGSDQDFTESDTPFFDDGRQTTEFAVASMDDIDSTELATHIAEITDDVNNARAQFQRYTPVNRSLTDKLTGWLANSNQTPEASTENDSQIGYFFREHSMSHTVRIAVDTTMLSEMAFSALTLDPNRRIIVELSFNWNYIESNELPKIVKIVQSKDISLNTPLLNDEVHEFGVMKWYLNNRLSTALRRNWINKKRKSLQPLVSDQSTGTSAVAVKGKDKGKAKEGPYEELIQRIISLGFSRKKAVVALNYAHFDADAAVNLLMDSQTVDQYEQLPESEYAKLEGYDKEKDTETGLKEHMLFNRDLNFTEAFENFFAEDNFILGITKYLNHRFQIVSSRCVICDDPLGFEGLKPAVCDKVLCCHSLEQYALGVDVVSELKHNPVVVDLLISLTSMTASMSASGRDSFDPYPFQIEAFVDAQNNKKPTEVQNAIDKLPCVETMLRVSQGSNRTLQEHLNKIDKVLYPLLQWILTSNRAHLSPIPEHKRIMGIPDTVKQFVMVSSNPSREKTFREKRKQIATSLKRARGSFYAFHGSASGNWHCILRKGLRNYSNTKMMSAGAAAGPGIYMANSMATSSGYMGHTNKNWVNSKLGTFRCMAVCEVLDQKGTNPKLHTHGWGYVVEQEELVNTRYLLIFTDSYNNYNSSLSALADSLTYPEDLYN